MKYQQGLGMLMAMVVLAVGSVQSEVLYEWNFSSQADGTALSDIASSGTQAPVNFSASAMSTGVTVSKKNLVMNWPGENLKQVAQNTYADITDLSSGTYWLVCEINAISMPSEGGIFDVLFNKTGDTSGTISGLRFRRVGSRVDAGLLSKSSASVASFSTSTTTPITFVVELNLDAGKTKLLYNEGDNKWGRSKGYGAIEFVEVTHIRIRAGQFAEGNEMDLGAVYLTDVNPVMAP